jgi:hypothetical protein
MLVAVAMMHWYLVCWRTWHDNVFAAISIQVCDERCGVHTGRHFCHPLELNVQRANVCPVGCKLFKPAVEVMIQQLMAFCRYCSNWACMLATDAPRMGTYWLSSLSLSAALCRYLLSVCSSQCLSEATGLLSWQLASEKRRSRTQHQVCRQHLACRR